MSAALLLAVALPVLGLIVLANFGERYELPRTLTYLFLALLVGGVLLNAGLLLAANPRLATLAGGAASAGPLTVTALAGLLAGASLTPGARTLAARVIPIRPDSPVHATALVLALLVGGNALAVALSPNFLSDLARSNASLSQSAFLLQGILFAAAALAGVGLGTRRTWEAARTRLGLAVPTVGGLAVALLLVPVFFGFSCVADKASQALTPGTSQAIDTIVRQLFRAFASPAGALLLGLVAGVSEELLFRGALVPRFGVVFSAVLFASLHSEYGISLQTADVFLLGVLLGVLRRRAGTTASIVAHGTYDAGVGMLALTNLNILGCS